MNRLGVMIVVELAISGILVAQRAGPETAAITGSVQKLDSTDAVGGAFVELRATSPAPPLIAAADEAGRFAFREVPPGEYTLAATHPGYVRTEYGQRKLGGPGVRITVKAGEQLNAIVLSLTPTATIFGQIRGPKGLPAANVQVHALKYGYEDGRRVLQTIRVVRTNDEGDYRLFWLPPGPYIVMAIPLLGAVEGRLWIAGPEGTASGFRPIQVASGAPIVLPDETGSTPFYFPGTVRMDEATVIDLKPGEARLTNLNLITLPALHVRGVVTNLPPVVGGNAAGPPTSASVRLDPLTPSSLEKKSAPVQKSPVDLRTGAFDIRGVLPGSYTLVATASGGGRDRTLLTAGLALEVRGGDIDNLRLALGPSFDLTARVSVEGAVDNAAEIAKLLPLRVALNGYVGQPDRSQPGTFVMSRLTPDVYRVRVEPLRNGYVKAARYGDIDVLEEGLRLNGPSTGFLEITINTNAGTVTGSVVGQDGPARNAVVVVVPDPTQRRRADLYKNVISGTDGTFRITGIAPGEYKVFSWIDVDAGAWQDPDFMKVYEELGKSIHIGEGSVASVEVTAIP